MPDTRWIAEYIKNRGDDNTHWPWPIEWVGVRDNEVILIKFAPNNKIENK